MLDGLTRRLPRGSTRGYGEPNYFLLCEKNMGMIGMKCDGCHDLLIDRLGMTRCQLARGRPTDDIKVCVWMKRYVQAQRTLNKRA